MTEAARLHESLPAGPAGRFQLPWPMTGLEAARWYALLVPALVLPTVVLAWVTTAATEPSLWRVTVPLAWLLLFKVAALPGLARALRPADTASRWDHYAAQSLGLR